MNDSGIAAEEIERMLAELGEELAKALAKDLGLDRSEEEASE